MNVDIRFGYNSNSGFDPNSKITNNERWEANCYMLTRKFESCLLFTTRCGTYFGPALVQSQWIEINCGFKDGLHGR